RYLRQAPARGTARDRGVSRHLRDQAGSGAAEDLLGLDVRVVARPQPARAPGLRRLAQGLPLSGAPAPIGIAASASVAITVPDCTNAPLGALGTTPSGSRLIPKIAPGRNSTGSCSIAQPTRARSP